MRAIILLCLLALPALAQAQSTGQSGGQPGGQPPGQSAGPVPLPTWFVEIDTAKKGEVARADFLKHRMKSFDELDTNKDGKVSLDEFLKLAEPPYSNDVAGGPSLEDRRNRIRSAFQNLDLNSSGFIERAEAEAPIQSEFNHYDTDRDNKVTEPEIRLIMQRMAQRQAAERQQMEAERRKGMMALSDLIDMQMRDA
ncbi:MAG TPA: EF-hand domain-containing protein, partial [Reyranella sp.]|nr:EF-hand domain-containing protein [Reyranella sp.]